MPTMYDAVNLANIPADATAVAGYVNGRWPTYAELAKRWPNAKYVSIAVTAEADADCLDIERFDATPAQAPAWVRRQLARGVKKPIVYCAVSDAKTVLSVLTLSGIKRSQIRLWTAHYTKVAHRCDKSCGFGMPTVADATQFTDTALGRSLDESLCSVAFLDPEWLSARRRLLRAWVLAQRAKGATWAWLKSQPEWKLWRKLGGR